MGGAQAQEGTCMCDAWCVKKLLKEIACSFTIYMGKGDFGVRVREGVGGGG